MIEVPCYNCGSMDHVPYARENGYKLVKCAGCGLLYVNPRPGDEQAMEGARIGAHRGERTLESTGRYTRIKVAIYHKVLPELYGTELSNQKWTWLDVGCGHGELLVALREMYGNNVAAKGIEPNQYKVAAARNRGLEVGYFDLASHDERYDCVSLVNVYSHLTNPSQMLCLVKQRLRPNGELLLNTGDTASLPANLHPTPFGLPDHLSFVSLPILSKMLKEIGFEIIKVNKYPAFRLRIMWPWVAASVVKLFLPHKHSGLRSIYSLLRVAKYRTDMWIRARAVAGCVADGSGRELSPPGSPHGQYQ